MTRNAKRLKLLRLLGAGLVLGVLAGLAAWHLRPAGEPTRDSLDAGRSALYDASAKRAFYESLGAGDREKVIKLKSRWLLPGTDFEQKPGREQVFVQFKRWLTDAEKQRLAQRGLHLGDPFSGHSYRATLDDGAWGHVKDHPELDGVARVKLGDKLHKPIHEVLENGGEALVALEPAPGAGDIHSRLVRRFGRRARRYRGDVIVRLNAPEIRELAERDEIAYVHFLGYVPVEHTPPPPAPAADDSPELVPAPDNSDASTIHNVDDLQAGPYNLDGAGVRVGMDDGGYVRDTHEALNGRVTLVETNYGLSWHATHVAGTIIGDPPGTPQALGMAPAATLYSYDYDSDLDGVGTVYPQDKVTHAAVNYSIVVHNNSWGYVGGWEAGAWEGEGIFGDYDWYARGWDLVAVANPDVTICKSSGNDRSDTGVGADPQDGTEYATPGLTNPFYDCISNWGCSKNVVTVGATTDAGAITDFSSIGPADDGRIKPDVVANGEQLYSATSTTDTAYTWASGTSMACPVTSGISALVVQAWRAAHAGAAPDSMVVKGLLIHTATDLGHPGPDYVYGFGLVDAQAVVDLLQADAGGSNQIKQDNVADSAQQDYTLAGVAGGTSVKVTLTWMDPAGASGADPAIVNDLDLELIDPDGVTHYPYKLDPADPPADATNAGKNAVDTVEQAIASCATAGNWTVRVKGASVPSGPQSFVVVTNIASGTVIYVDQDAGAGADDGSSWGDAFLDLEDALTAAGDGDRIWVAEGTYKPSAPGGRASTFLLKSGVEIYGGFASGEVSLGDRDVAGNPTILSGDIGAGGDNSDNCYHVVTGADSATLDGFTITEGNADGAAPDNYGGGMYNSGVSPTVANCTFTDNTGSWGGGMYNLLCSPTVTDCTFDSNAATLYGGGMASHSSASPSVTGCTFTQNTAAQSGGGMFNNLTSSPTVTDCTFTQNTSDTYGAGMTNSSSSPSITGCTFSDNAAVQPGGGIYNGGTSAPALANCLFTGNSARDGGGIHNISTSAPTVTNCTFEGNSAAVDGGAIASLSSANPTVKNCILWGNTAGGAGAQIYNDASVTVTYSCVQGGWAGTGNIDADPLFANGVGDDYHLKSIMGRWTAGPVWVVDAVHSPCIDAGDPASAYNNEPASNGGRINMGVYGNTAQASKTSPKIALSTASLSPLVTVGGNAASQSFTVTNSGAGTLNYTIADDAAWLDCAPNSGDSTGEADTIDVTYTTSALAIGIYNATITVSDPGATNNPQTITVTLTVKKKSSGGGGGGGGGGCSLAAGSEPLGWGLPYLALAGGWLLSRLRRRRKG